jgi:hypothetical protein
MKTSTPGTFRPRRTTQRGAASLAVTLIMLAVSALTVLYANRGQLFEQRIAANQARSTTAFEVAEAGIEWAMARLNDTAEFVPSATATCLHTGATGSARFMETYGNPTGIGDDPTAFNFSPPTGSRVACAVAEDNTLTCRCPAPGATLTLPTPGRRSFVVSFDDVAGDPGSLRVTSQGCFDSVDGSNNAVMCNPAGTNGATSTITMLVKFVPGAGSFSNAALTTGGYAQVCGSFNITNQVQGSGGFLVNSGGPTQIGNGTYESGPLPPGAHNCGGGGGQTLATIPGSPITASIVPNDPALAAASATTDAMMSATFGMTLSEYKQSPTCEIGTVGGNETATALGTALLNAYTSQRCTRFWVNGPIAIQGNTTLGTAQRPIMLASAHDVSFSGNFTLYGIVYGDNVTWDNLGTGTHQIYGQVVARGNYYANGNGSIIFQDSILREFALGSGEFLRVPGSWADF